MIQKKSQKIFNVVLTGAGSRFGKILSTFLVKDPNINTILLTSNPDKLDYKNLSNANIYKINLSDPNNIKKVFNDLYDNHGELDVLINNAAVNSIPNYENFIINSNDLKTKDYYLVNCAGALYCIKYFLCLGNFNGKKIINILAGRALTGHTKDVEYYSSKAGLYNATLTLANDYPEHYFRNIMTGKIDTGLGGDSPKSIWLYFLKFINEKKPKQYKEVYFRKPFEFYRKIFYFYFKHFRSCERVDVKRR